MTKVQTVGNCFKITVCDRALLMDDKKNLSDELGKEKLEKNGNVSY